MNLLSICLFSCLLIFHSTDQQRTIECVSAHDYMGQPCDDCTPQLCYCDKGTQKWCFANEHCCCRESVPQFENCIQSKETCNYYCCSKPSKPCGDNMNKCCTPNKISPTAISVVPSVTCTSTPSPSTSNHSTNNHLYHTPVSTTSTPENDQKNADRKLWLIIQIVSGLLAVLLVFSCSFYIERRHSQINNDESANVLGNVINDDSVMLAKQYNQTHGTISRTIISVAPSVTRTNTPLPSSSNHTAYSAQTSTTTPGKVENILQTRFWNLNVKSVPMIRPFSKKIAVEQSVKRHSNRTLATESSLVEKYSRLGQSVESSLKLKGYGTLVPIGQGGQGCVYKAKHLLDDKKYAIKVIELSDVERDIALKEVEILSKLKTDRVVRYYNSWSEDSRLYIQMELCSDNLKNILEIKPSMFGRDVNRESMHSLEYYITCRLFVEILQCVQYLHELNPPLIHRDVKPGNILLDGKSINGRFIKLCDLGLSKFQYDTTMDTSRYGGTLRYKAPELVSMQKFDWRSDIYSLSITAQELFELDINESVPKSSLREKLGHLKDILIKMSDPVYKQRPSCKDILDSCDKWCINLSDIEIPKNIIDRQLPNNSLSKFIYYNLKI